MSKYSKILSLFAIITGVFFASTASAISFTPPKFNDTGYLGSYVSVSVAEPIVMEAGTTKEIIVKIKNKGTKTWYPTGTNYVSAYTVNPNYRSSVFSGTGWLSKNQAAKILTTTKSGETAQIKIKLTAPTKIGTYREDFYLAAENKTWIKSSYFYLDIKVTPATAKPTATATTTVSDASGNSTEGVNDTASEVSAEYKANLLAFSARQVSAVGGGIISFTVRYKNIGTETWKNYLWQESGSTISGDTQIAGVTRVALADSTWLNEKTIVSKTQTVAPDGVTEITFNFRAPKSQGAYIARFQLTADSHTLDGGTLELPVTVTADAPIGYVEPVFTTAARALITEPKIRVGLYKSEDAVKFISPFVYQVWSGEILKGELLTNETATLSYDSGTYQFKSAELNFSGEDKIRLVPVNPDSYFTLTNYSRLVSWKGNKNFNAYRNTFEYVYSNKSATTWVVNELLLDEYTAGIAETSNGAAMEYIKALLTAARSYAYYHMNNGVAADQRTYDVVATTADQLYLGYNSEVLMPRVVQAARATYGEMVTYKNTPVITPYFGHSDGSTRTWKSVWGGTDKDWLKSVACKYDEGESMFGHGVGMSAQDASQRADKDGWTYDQLLKYYYTGVDVQRIY
ncbi:MAG: SpoIID/LytB domain-containing protein [Patescibacteria group bacterium]